MKFRIWFLLFLLIIPLCFSYPVDTYVKSNQGTTFFELYRSDCTDSICTSLSGIVSNYTNVTTFDTNGGAHSMRVGTSYLGENWFGLFGYLDENYVPDIDIFYTSDSTVQGPGEHYFNL